MRLNNLVLASPSRVKVYSARANPRSEAERTYRRALTETLLKNGAKFYTYDTLPAPARAAATEYLDGAHAGYYLVGELPTEYVKQRVMAEFVGPFRWLSFDAYHRWYVEDREKDGRMPNYPKVNRWPSLLAGADMDGFIWDGWHRFHAYVRAGHRTVPVYMLVSEGDAPRANPRRRNPATHEHRYGARNRPPGYATVPKGFVRVDPPPFPQEARVRHGVVVYDRPLTEEEVRGYELHPYLPLAEIVDGVIASLGEYARDYADNVREESAEQVRSETSGYLDEDPKPFTDVPLAGVYKHVAQELLRRFAPKQNPRRRNPNNLAEIKRAAEWLYEDDPEWVEGGCADMSGLLLDYATERGLRDVRLVVGMAARRKNAKKGFPHVWLEVGGERFDPSMYAQGDSLGTYVEGVELGRLAVAGSYIDRSCDVREDNEFRLNALRQGMRAQA